MSASKNAGGDAKSIEDLLAAGSFRFVRIWLFRELYWFVVKKQLDLSAMQLLIW